MYNSLDEKYRRLGDEDNASYPPPFPWRVKAFVYACGVVAGEERVEMAQAIVGGGAGREMM